MKEFVEELERRKEAALSMDGEKITPEKLGGWEIYAEITGQIGCFAGNEEHCPELIKEFFSYMPTSPKEEPPFLGTQDDPR